MTARDDYPRYAASGAEAVNAAPAALYEQMCDEIDRLRDKINNMIARSDDALKYAALNDLIRELTRHADAMRDLLNETVPAWRNTTFAGRVRDTTDAYDQFIKEA